MVFFYVAIQCDNGHLVCSTCCSEFSNMCHECSKRITLTRCIAFENLLQSLERPCPNEKYGCRETISYSGKKNHEECIYVPCYCPLPGCDFVASSEVLSNHVSCKHEDSRFLFVYGNSFDVSLKFDDEAIVLQEENDGKLYILTINSNLMGNAINISCIGPNSSEPGHYYDILAKSQASKMKLQSVTKNIQQSTLTLPSSEFLVIPFGFFESLEPKICITFKMQIYVNNMDGKMIPLRVKNSDTIVNVKEKILEQDGMPVHQQNLLFSGLSLADNLTLADYNIQEKSTLDLMLRLIGD
ncbi:RING-type E3 ubiquitin transferase [Trifolium repens]|nr:RING-type E3 ubiquitin transferase [Trifolium repens]